jgi:haloalkane dehalogenase
LAVKETAKMKFLRTPDERFENLPDYPFRPNYLQLGPLRMHYLDEGPRSGPVMLLLHGEPSWSFLYRKMIPVFVRAGLRCVAPDLIGFGKSDKPTARKDYSYLAHVEWLKDVIRQLDLQDIVLVCQDWGSLLGLRLAMEEQARFSRIAISNGFLPTGSRPLPTAFKIWRAFATFSPLFPIAKIIQSGSATKLDPEVLRAYDAPFPKDSYKKGARAFPRLVPGSASDPAVPANRAAWDALGAWQRPFLTSFASRDPITRGADRVLQAHIPGAQGQPHSIIRGAGHFVQEDKGEEWAQLILDWMKVA